MNTIFFIAGGVAFVSTILAITNRNAIHALLYLILSLLALSVIFYISGAPFMAALEVIIYAGAIMVLFIFVVMMLNIGLSSETENKRLPGTIWIFPVILASVLLVIFIYAIKVVPDSGNEQRIIGPKEVGKLLFTRYMIGVQIAAVLLMAGIVGAYHIGRQKKKIEHRFITSGK